MVEPLRVQPSLRCIIAIVCFGSLAEVVWLAPDDR
jgi:hypothetical protein